MRQVYWGLLPCALALCGCREDALSRSQPTTQPSAAISAATTPPRTAVSAPPMATAKPGVPHQSVEVELFGTVAPPPGHDVVRIEISVSGEDCSKADAKILGRIPLSMNGKFFIEVIPPWGTDLTVCASGETKHGGVTTKVSGKAEKTFRAEGVGEVIFQDIVIKLLPESKPK